MLYPLHKFRPGQFLQFTLGHRNSHIADRINKLQCGYKCIVFQRPPEKPELNGTVIAEINCAVPAVVTALGFLQDFLSCFFVTIASRPSVHIILTSSGEAEDLVPVLFYQEKNLADDLFLLRLIVTKSVPVDMDMQTAGTRLVGAVAHFYRFMKNHFPVHVMLMIVKCHWVRNDLEAVVNTAVRLYVDMLMTDICNFFELACIIIVLTSAVYFQLNSKIALTITIENRLRLIAVLLDLVIEVIIAAVAIRIIASPVNVVVVDDSVAALTAMIIVIIAGFAKCGIIVLYCIIYPDGFAAVVAGGAVFVNTLMTKELIVHPCSFLFFDLTAADVADSYVFFHFNYLQIRIIMIRQEAPYHSYNTYLKSRLDSAVYRQKNPYEKSFS